MTTAVVTGAARGIGRAIAARLIREGWSVVAADIDEEALAATSAEIGATAVPGDAASTDGVDALVSVALDHLGSIDVFVANAGITSGAGLGASDADWARVLEVNVLSQVRAARRLVPHWLAAGAGGTERTLDLTGAGGTERTLDLTGAGGTERTLDLAGAGGTERTLDLAGAGGASGGAVPERGRLVLTASAAGLLTMLGDLPYSVTKHGSVALAEWIAATYRHRGIVAQAVCPLGVQTRILDEAGPLRDVLTRDGTLTPDEVADAVWQGLQGDAVHILPHPSVQRYYAGRAADPDAWVAGMNRIQQRLDPLTHPTDTPSTEDTATITKENP